LLLQVVLVPVSFTEGPSGAGRSGWVAPEALVTVPGRFERRRNRFLSVWPAVHSAQDVVSVDGEPVALQGKFAYGPWSRDLEGEVVEVFVHDGQRWLSVGQAVSDRDGRTLLVFEPQSLVGPGHYWVAHVVVGDGTVVYSTLSWWPEGLPVVVFDIDGTLTTGDDELMRELISGDYDPVSYPAAAELTRHYWDEGYGVVYVTGRPYVLSERTRSWLKDGGFAPGPLWLTQSLSASLPSAAGVAAYKTAVLAALQAQGLVLVAAYGNAMTDITAYEAVGIPKAQTFIIGPNAGSGQTQALSSAGYGDHLRSLQAASPASE